MEYETKQIIETLVDKLIEVSEKHGAAKGTSEDYQSKVLYLKERVMFYANKYPQLFWLLTKDDFMVAKALWGEEKWYTTGEKVPEGRQALLHPTLEAWQYHLQQMVIAEDPIKYLEENI